MDKYSVLKQYVVWNEPLFQDVKLLSRRIDCNGYNVTFVPAHCITSIYPPILNSRAGRRYETITEC